MEAYNVKYGTKVRITDDSVKTPPSSIPIKKAVREVRGQIYTE